MNIGTCLKNYRKENDLTQEQLANKLGLSRQHVSMLELNQREMGLMLMETLRKRKIATPEELMAIAKEQVHRRNELRKEREKNEDG